jgi:hypothetical protein
VRRNPLRPPALVLVACLAVAACGGGDDPPVAAPADTTAAPTTTTTSPVPDEITVEYVQQVVDTLDDSYGDMIRRYRDDGGPTPETEGWPDLLFAGQARESNRVLVDAVVEVEFANIRDEPEGPETVVEELVTADPRCVYFGGTRSLQPMILRVIDRSEAEGYFGLHPAAEGRVDLTGRELPAWVLFQQSRLETGDMPEDPCR